MTPDSGSGMNADSRLRRDFKLWSDPRLQTRNDSKLPDYSHRRDSKLQTPE